MKTKQEQIEEMANDIAKCCPDKVDDGCFDKNMNCVSCIAMELYNVGYRKEDEVRKETAEKFAEKLKEKIDNQQYILLPTATVKYMIDEIAKEIISEYGVEMEE